MFEDFFVDLDARWPMPHTDAMRTHLRLIGSSALMLQTSYQRGTKDGDVLQMSDLTIESQRLLRTLAGKGTPLHQRHRVYLDIVPNGIPFLAHVPRWHDLTALNSRLRALKLSVLDVVDVAVAKLARFSVDDQNDIRAMIVGGHVHHDEFVATFKAAVDELSGDARAAGLSAHLARFHSVERDMFFVDESEIELPDKY